jgi:hypothetical protein
MISLTIGRLASSALGEDVPVTLEASPQGQWVSAVDDRRISPRLPMQGLSVWTEEGVRGGEGNVGLGGIFFRGRGEKLSSSTLTVGFTLPGDAVEIRAQGEVLEQKHDGEMLSLRVRFTELPLSSELAIARYIDDQLKAHAGL